MALMCVGKLCADCAVGFSACWLIDDMLLETYIHVHMCFGYVCPNTCSTGHCYLEWERSLSFFAGLTLAEGVVGRG